MSESLRDLLSDLPRERTWVLPALLRMQARFGYVSSEAIEAIAQHLRLTANDVDGIAWGYPDLRRDPPPGVQVRVCEGLSCVVAGADPLSASLERDEANPGVEISRAPCLFACAVAPVVAVGTECHGRASLASVASAIRAARAHD